MYIVRFSGSDSQEAWNRCQDIVKELSQAHIDRIVVSSFTSAVDRADECLKPVLHILCALHALWTIQGLAFQLSQHCVRDSPGQRTWGSS